jgi:AbrB family looped-hinge helix DNA binding protein
MATVAVSSKFRVVVPKEVRAALGIKVGQEVDIRIEGDRAIIELLPDIRLMRGFLPGVDTDVPNDPEGP